MRPDDLPGSDRSGDRRAGRGRTVRERSPGAPAVWTGSGPAGRQPSQVVDQPGHHRHDAEQQERGQQAQPERHGGPDADPAGGVLGRRARARAASSAPSRSSASATGSPVRADRARVRPSGASAGSSPAPSTPRPGPRRARAGRQGRQRVGGRAGQRDADQGERVRRREPAAHRGREQPDDVRQVGADPHPARAAGPGSRPGRARPSTTPAATTPAARPAAPDTNAQAPRPASGGPEPAPRGRARPSGGGHRAPRRPRAEPAAGRPGRAARRPAAAAPGPAGRSSPARLGASRSIQASPAKPRREPARQAGQPERGAEQEGQRVAARPGADRQARRSGRAATRRAVARAEAQLAADHAVGGPGVAQRRRPPGPARRPGRARSGGRPARPRRPGASPSAPGSGGQRAAAPLARRRRTPGSAPPEPRAGQASAACVERRPRRPGRRPARRRAGRSTRAPGRGSAGDRGPARRCRHSRCAPAAPPREHDGQDGRLGRPASAPSTDRGRTDQRHHHRTSAAAGQPGTSAGGAVAHQHGRGGQQRRRHGSSSSRAEPVGAGPGTGPAVVVEGDGGGHRDQPVGGPRRARPTSRSRRRPSAVHAEVEHDVDGGGELAVRGLPAEPGGQRQRLDARRHVGGGVGVQRAAAALVPGVEGRQQVDDLAAAHLADDEPVGPHPQRLPDQGPHGHLARALEVGRPGLEPHAVRVVGRQLVGVLDQDQALRRVGQREQGGEQRRLARTRCRR